MDLEKRLAKGKKILRDFLCYSLIASSFSLASCGKDSPTTPEPDEPKSNKPYVLEANAKEISNIFGYNESLGQIIFSEASDISDRNIKIGDVLISGITSQTPNGFIRRATSINKNVINTTSATLNDAVKECELQSSFAITNPNQTAPGEFNFNVPINQVVYDKDDNLSTKNDQVLLIGNVKFNLNVDDFYVKTDASGFKNFRLSVTNTESLDLTLVSNVLYSTASKKIPLIPNLYCSPIQIGPIVVVPKLNVYLNFEGSIAASSIKASQSALSIAEIEYKSNQWSSSSDLINSFSNPTIYFSAASASGKVSVGPQLDLLIYNSVGAYIGANGFFKSSIDLGKTPWWTFSGGFNAKMGAKINVFGWAVADFSKTIFEIEKTISQSQDSPLIANLTATPKSGISPLEVLLDASASSPNQQIQKYSFTFGDGGTYTETSSNASDGIFDGKTKHTYNKGTFTAELKIEDNLGRTSQNSEIIQVTEQLPSNRKIVFGRDTDIYIINSDGTNETSVVSNGYMNPSPVLSPDGSKIAFASKRDGDFEIYTINSDGTGEKKLTNNTYNDFNPAWAPDGSLLAFDSSRDGISGIYFINPNTGTESLFTLYASDPSWSSDGSQIVYNSGTCIYKENSDGSPSNLYCLAEGNYPDFSGNNEIVFTSYQDGNAEIYKMDSDGNIKTRLTNNSYSDSYPAWSPDGSKIVFTSNRNGISGIYIMNSDGTGEQFLTTGNFADW